MSSEMDAFTCPRCGDDVDETYYGPCTSCREELRATVTATARATESAAFVPKSNVVPNQVATKD